MNDRPNILLLMTDDHAPWALGCYGNREVRSPTLDRLASKGVRFANAFTPIPVCSAARACLFTGRMPSQHGIHDWLKEPDVADTHPCLNGQTNIGQLLQRGGYETALAQVAGIQ